eukprot:gene38956-47388_t
MPTEVSTGACAVCAVQCTNRCAKCKVTYYCSREHQVSHWPEHKVPCKAISNPSSKASEAPFPSASPNSWANGLNQAQQYEWLIDCHRM